MAVRRPRRSVVVLAGEGSASESDGRALVNSIAAFGVQTHYLGNESNASRIVAAVTRHQADAIDLCVAQPGCVLLLRQLLRELMDAGRRDVSIVVHRIR